MIREYHAETLRDWQEEGEADAWADFIGDHVSGLAAQLESRGLKRIAELVREHGPTGWSELEAFGATLSCYAEQGGYWGGVESTSEIDLAWIRWCVMQRGPVYHDHDGWIALVQHYRDHSRELLLSYRDDLFRHDRRRMTEWDPRLPFLWLGHELGSVLLDPRANRRSKECYRDHLTKSSGDYKRGHYLWWDGRRLTRLEPEAAIARYMETTEMEGASNGY